MNDPETQAVPELPSEPTPETLAPLPPSSEAPVALPPAIATTPAKSQHEHEIGVMAALQWLLSVIVIAAFVMTFIVQAFEIPSDSMERTLLVGDYLLVNKIAYANGGFWAPLLPYDKLHRGDIVVFRYPVHPSQHFVKRVIGVPGDRIHLLNKQVFVNGKPLIEPYTIYKSTQRDYFRDDFPTTKYISGNVDPKWWIQMKKLIEDGNLIVPEGNYFVLGDNRDDSLDSRYWGFVPQENVVGRPLLIYWSVNREGFDEDAENQTRDAKLKRLTDGFLRMFRNARWSRTMTIVRGFRTGRNRLAKPKKPEVAVPEKKKETTMEFIASMASILVVGLFIITFCLQAFEIPSSSMENTLLIGDHVFVDRVTPAPRTKWFPLIPYRELKRGDIVVFLSPAEPGLFVVKRIIGVPGDSIHLQDGVVYRNGEVAKEPFVIHSRGDYNPYRDNFPNVAPMEGSGVTPEWHLTMGEYIKNGNLVVPPDSYFAMGDNRDVSYDSRWWGFIPKENVVGRPMFIYWSFETPANQYLKTAWSDRIKFIFNVVFHFFSETRWNRMFHIVR